MIQGLGTLAGVVAVVWGALYGTRAWKEQKRAERRLEMAERILTATHKGRSALANIRSVMIWGHELTAAEEKLKEDNQWQTLTVSRRERLSKAQAFYNRINRTRDEQIALDDCLPMARALFNEELEQALEQLRHQFWVVQVTVDSYIDDENGPDTEFTKEIRRAMYDVKPRAGETSKVSDAIAEAVKTIETICIPALRLE